MKCCCNVAALFKPCNADISIIYFSLYFETPVWKMSIMSSCIFANGEGNPVFAYCFVYYISLINMFWTFHRWI